MSQDDDVASVSPDLAATVSQLERQLAAANSEREQLRAAAGEKAELLKRLDELSREREQLRADAGEKPELLKRLDAILRERDDLKRRAESAEAGLARLSAPAEGPEESLRLLWKAVCDLTAQGVAWVRSKIPADSPALPYFDKTIAIAKQAGCWAVTNGWAFLKWATPQVVALVQTLRKEVEARLAKK